MKEREHFSTPCHLREMEKGVEIKNTAYEVEGNLKDLALLMSGDWRISILEF